MCWCYCNRITNFPICSVRNNHRSFSRFCWCCKTGRSRKRRIATKNKWTSVSNNLVSNFNLIINYKLSFCASFPKKFKNKIFSIRRASSLTFSNNCTTFEPNSISLNIYVWSWINTKCTWNINLFEWSNINIDKNFPRTRNNKILLTNFIYNRTINSIFL